MPLFRHSGGSGGFPTGFRAPAIAGIDSADTAAATLSLLPLRRRERTVIYPDSKGITQAEITVARLAKRAHIEYHQPVREKKAAQGGDAECGNEAEAAVDTGSAQENTHPGGGDPVVEQKKQQLPQGQDAGCGTAQEGGEEEEEKSEVVSRYPVSPYGKLYFQVETDAATRHESTGIIIIETEQLGVMMYDRAGRQFGNRPDPGYPIKEEDVNNAKAGMTLKVASKTVLLITALKEESFRSGEFFLRYEHQLRKKEEKQKEKAAAAAGLHVIKPKMSFGQSLSGCIFAQPVFRKRPRDGQTGFTVPVAGRPKTGPSGIRAELKPLHDPDREGAVVLFRADYKRDANGRLQVSVVVDPVIGDKLRPHQRAGVRFLFDCITGERMPGYHGAILADEMGLGKTIQTVATIYTCLRQGKHGVPTARKCLVVTPSSLVKNWCNEFDKWLGEGAVKYFSISESTPKGDRIISRFDGEGDVLVISYDQLRKYIARISTLRSVELVVCDEGHRLKNAEVKTTKAVDMLPTRNRIILSGTPIQNDLSEFHAMVGFVNPGILGSRDVFARVFEEPVMQGRDPDCPEHLRSLGSDRAHYLSNLTQRFILRRTQSINESYLPPKVDVTVFVRLGELQSVAYEKLSDLVESSSCPPLVLISALRKLCNHMDLFYEAVLNSSKEEVREGRGLPKSVLPKGYKSGTLSEAAGGKMHFVSLMLDELRNNGDRDKLVIVSNFTQTLDVIANMCRQKRISFFQLDGSMPVKRRQEVVDRFNVPESQEIVFLLSSKAGGVGLNLIGANRLILFDPDWNPANDAQAMGRVWRDGQKKRVFIYRLLSAGSIEEKIYQRQVSKQGLSANVVDMKSDSKQHFTLEELRSLFCYRKDTRSDTHDLLHCTNCEAVVKLLASSSSGAGKAKELSAPMKFRRVGEKKSGPRMDELRGWRHFARCEEFPLDKVVRAISSRAPGLCSFIFADERDNTASAATNGKSMEGTGKAATVRVERPFVQDEEQIICPSQQEHLSEESELEIELHDDDDEEEEEEEEEEEFEEVEDDDDEE
ncbi:putative DNA repair and recombination protein RAD54 [Trypanosoma cruzi]|uniref:DNA repair and recombination protein RAD54, putative n=2 Tax=Trypanosoma cruzi TaxID=5693 RepID=Q4DV35_TRYCC|nr:DNA repair and recombination protein RAD54, putative [Trypanosoma cruzi]EAN96409.1 DNA repair and recombination protein RAD54, putative [Trypanosoma cruzi]PWV10407.1 putative DNA repair and recombination protein RAD54 [Trypanosoma cruzi]RNC58089.1 putative DNA repair and recombination protein RAD54 [Trypanosoma cruzi]|eukprot:XP_818260.1 DNA repair and recombination protein RAD54 [Trypanosoma cruzi strain CL Brener]